MFLSNISCLQLCQMFYRGQLCEWDFQILDHKQCRRPPPLISHQTYATAQGGSMVPRCCLSLWWSVGLEALSPGDRCVSSRCKKRVDGGSWNRPIMAKDLEWNFANEICISYTIYITCIGLHTITGSPQLLIIIIKLSNTRFRVRFSIKINISIIQLQSTVNNTYSLIVVYSKTPIIYIARMITKSSRRGTSCWILVDIVREYVFYVFKI